MTPPAEPPAAPLGVSRFEYSLVRLARFLTGHMPAEQAAPLVAAKVTPAPPCVGRNAVRLVQDTLSKGLVLYLVRAGGWRRDRYLRGNQPVEGRAWDRHRLDARQLTFSRHPFAFLMWLTAEKPTDTKEPWDADPAEQTAADELFFALAFDALRQPAVHDVAVALSGRACFRRNALAWLYAPADLATPDDTEPPDFAPLFTGTRAVILECLQPALAQRWVRSERAKGQIGDWRRMRHQGAAEAATLSAYLSAAEKANRPDLARFVLWAASAVLNTTSDLAPSYWTGGLQGQGPPRLADRLVTQRAALAVPRQMETLQRWDRRARSVGYWDDDYAASQLWKADWEAARGDATAAHARRVLDQLEPLRT